MDFGERWKPVGEKLFSPRVLRDWSADLGHFTIPRESNVSIGVYNILGQLVSTLVNKHKKAGSYLAQLDAKDFASGTYFYRIEEGDFVETRSMLLLR